MSIVGPRPHAVEHDRHYAALIAGYGDRARAKPGITGLAQVSGLRGATPTSELMAQRVAADNRYIETASLALDVAIVLRTAWSVLLCRDAY
jgi:lipopolysaccharide/colanic/teichoic acid biosynthesis glycosyltransferase